MNAKVLNFPRPLIGSGSRKARHRACCSGPLSGFPVDSAGSIGARAGVHAAIETRQRFLRRRAMWCFDASPPRKAAFG